MNAHEAGRAPADSPWRRSGAHRALVLVAIAGAILALSAGSAAASTSSERDLIALLNTARTGHGLPPLTVSADLSQRASAHAKEMAASGSLFHSASLGTLLASGWAEVGENVGCGSSVARIHSAFMASSAHRSNILSSGYTQVGVAIAKRGGKLYATEIFGSHARTSQARRSHVRAATSSTSARAGASHATASRRTAAAGAPKPKARPHARTATARARHGRLAPADAGMVRAPILAASATTTLSARAQTASAPATQMIMWLLGLALAMRALRADGSRAASRWWRRGLPVPASTDVGSERAALTR